MKKTLFILLLNFIIFNNNAMLIETQKDKYLKNMHEYPLSGNHFTDLSSSTQKEVLKSKPLGGNFLEVIVPLPVETQEKICSYLLADNSNVNTNTLRLAVEKMLTSPMQEALEHYTKLNHYRKNPNKKMSYFLKQHPLAVWYLTDGKQLNLLKTKIIGRWNAESAIALNKYEAESFSNLPVEIKNDKDIFGRTDIYPLNPEVKFYIIPEKHYSHLMSDKGNELDLPLMRSATIINSLDKQFQKMNLLNVFLGTGSAIALYCASPLLPFLGAATVISGCATLRNRYEKNSEKDYFSKYFSAYRTGPFLNIHELDKKEA